MRTCKMCGKLYVDESYEFCLEDGSPLSESESAATIVMQLRDDSTNEKPQDAETAINAGLSELFKLNDFKRLEFDANFERLIQRYRQEDIYKLIHFLRRLIGRAEHAAKNSEDNYDRIALVVAIAKDTAEEADAYLTEQGLI